MKRTQFKKDPDLMFLIQPMGQITFLKLQDEIIHNGCSVPVFVWNDFIIGGIEEYDNVRNKYREKQLFERSLGGF